MELIVDNSAASKAAQLVASIAGGVTVVNEPSAGKPLLKTASGNVEGLLPIARRIAEQNPKVAALLGSNETEAKQIEKWVGWLNKELQGPGADKNKYKRAIATLNKELTPVVFLVGHAFTLADIAIYAGTHSLVSEMDEHERFVFCALSRWFDFIQHREGFGNVLPTVRFNLNMPERKEKEAGETSTSAPAPASAAPSEEPAESARQKGGKRGGDRDSAQAGAESAAKEKAPKKEAPAPKKEASASKEPQPKKGKGDSGGAAEEQPLITRVDIRVGRVLKAWKHEAADRLYVEEIDVGESTPRTICSGLVEYVPLERLQGASVLVVCNLKPKNAKGIMSNGMVLAASNADHTKVELLVPPEGTVPGERVFFPGISKEEYNPDDVMNPKKKIFETVQEDLRTNAELVACYKDVPFMTSKGPVRATTIANGTIS